MPYWKRTGKVVQTVGLGGVGVSVTLIVNPPPAAGTHRALYIAYLSVVALGLFTGMGLSVFSILTKGSAAVGWVQRRLIYFTLYFVAVACFLRLRLAVSLAEVMFVTVSVLVVVGIIVSYLYFGRRFGRRHDDSGTQGNQISVISWLMTSSYKKNIVWDANLTKLYVEICSDEVMDGNRSTKRLNKKGWANVKKKFNKLAGKNLGKKEFKNKWDNLKNEWQTWKRLVGNETELRWNVDKRIIEAPDDWWDMKLLEMPAAAKFRDKGLQMPNEMELLFGDSIATGQHVWIPSSGPLPNKKTLEAYLEGTCDIDESPPTVLPADPHLMHSDKWKGKRVQSSSSGSNSKKQSPAQSVQVQMERLSEIAEAVQGLPIPKLRHA